MPSYFFEGTDTEGRSYFGIVDAKQDEARLEEEIVRVHNQVVSVTAIQRLPTHLEQILTLRPGQQLMMLTREALVQIMTFTMAEGILSERRKAALTKQAPHQLPPEPSGN